LPALVYKMRCITNLFVLCFILSACTPPETNQTAISFYYWRTVFKLTENEKYVLEQNEVTKLYVRYFDVALQHGEPVPLSAIAFDESPGDQHIIPVVYIRNEVMLQPALNVEELADKVLSYINQINTKHAIACDEIQIDCDWTLSSKETYFRFIDLLKKNSNKKLSATIRLHQVKYFRSTGVPAVDRGVLMYYNMGRIAPDSSNSIYERETAQLYTGSLKSYPLPLDIALPVFSWGIHVRNNTVIGLLNKVDETSFKEDEHFVMKEPPYFEVHDDIIKLGYYFEKGDRIKIESIRADDLEEMIEDLSEAMTQQPGELIFYDLDNFNLKHYQHEKHFFQKISRTL
jgi:hypothetical protein